MKKKGEKLRRIEEKMEEENKDLERLQQHISVDFITKLLVSRVITQFWQKPLKVVQSQPKCLKNKDKVKILLNMNNSQVTKALSSLVGTSEALRMLNLNKVFTFSRGRLDTFFTSVKDLMGIGTQEEIR